MANQMLYATLQLELREARAEIATAIARAEAAEADARECRSERARYGNAMTERLATAEAERDALRDALVEMRQYINRNDQLMASERWLLSTIEAALPGDNSSHNAP